MSSNKQMRWWGWGEPSETEEISERGKQFLAERVGFAEKPTVPLSIDQIDLPKSSVDESLIAMIKGVVGPYGYLDDQLARVRHATGKSYPDLIRQRTGQCQQAPDAVVMPTNQGQIAALLKLCSENGIAVVPFGGGTSVVGGVTPVRENFKTVITLSLERFSGVLSIDKQSRTATIAPGTLCPDAEAELNREGFTLGHFPQSFEFATVGGCVATRSAGQASTGYGRIDDLVLGLKMASPSGVIELKAQPASAAGPEMRSLIVGSEGIFGVISETALKVALKPTHTEYEGWMFPDFFSGAEAFRKLEQSELAPTIARLSDRHETYASLLMADKGNLKSKLLKSYLKARRRSDGCFAVIGWEGQEEVPAEKRLKTYEIFRKHGAVSLGEMAGKSWLKGRYQGPYLRDLLIDQGVFVETLETATQWSNLENLYEQVSTALKSSLSESGGDPYVMCHISHIYGSGASLYFTFLTKEIENGQVDQWRKAKQAASNAIVEAGGTITHHHATGSDHAPWMVNEVGTLGLDALRSVKSQFDPEGIMNPGKLGI